MLYYKATAGCVDTLWDERVLWCGGLSVRKRPRIYIIELYNSITELYRMRYSCAPASTKTVHHHRTCGCVPPRSRTRASARTTPQAQPTRGSIHCHWHWRLVA